MHLWLVPNNSSFELGGEYFLKAENTKQKFVKCFCFKTGLKYFFEYGQKVRRVK